MKNLSRLFLVMKSNRVRKISLGLNGILFGFVLVVGGWIGEVGERTIHNVVVV